MEQPASTAFEEHLSAVYPEIVRYARALAGSQVDGDDLIQEVLIRAWKGFPGLRDRNRFRQWMLRIVSNTHRSWARRQWLRRCLPLDQAADLPLEAGLAFEEREHVRRALAKLPRAQREALILFEVLGLRIEEIAALQEVSLSAVKSRLTRGRERLRRHYHKPGG